MAEQELKTYHGSCHCKAYEFTVNLPPLDSAGACNCSICAKNGYLWTFPLSKEDLVVTKGEGTLKEYLFGNKKMAHSFCPTCGVSIMATMGPKIGLNIRTIPDIDTEKLTIKPFDGAALGSAYEAPNGPKESLDDASTKTYGGSCHCGKVTYELKSKPLEELEATDCNCSICSRNAYLWLYPPKPDVTIHGKEHLSCYRFGTGFAGHSFCSTCGVALLNDFSDPENRSGRMGKVQPVNLRALNGVDISQMKIEKIDGKNFNPEAKLAQEREKLNLGRLD